jgi:hypothetical protein
VGVSEKLFVRPNPDHDPQADDSCPYIATYVPDLPANFDEPEGGYTFWCECDEQVPGVDSTLFAFETIPPLSGEDRSLLIDAIGEHLLDGCMTEKGTEQLLDIQRRLILMNQISQGVVPQSERETQVSKEV